MALKKIKRFHNQTMPLIDSKYLDILKKYSAFKNLHKLSYIRIDLISWDLVCILDNIIHEFCIQILGIYIRISKAKQALKIKGGSR